MKKIISGLICSIFVFGCSQQSNNESEPEAKADSNILPITAASTQQNFRQQMHSLTQAYFAVRPEIATYFGVEDEDAGAGTMSRLSDYSPVGETKRRAALRSMVQQLATMDRTKLTDSQLVSLGLIETEMKSALAPAETVEYGTALGEYGVWFMPYPVNHLSGLHVEFAAIMEDKFAVSNQSEADAFLARLKAYPAAMDGLIEKMNQDIKLGVVAPDFVIEKTLNNLQLQMNYPANAHPIVKSFQAKLQSTELAEQEAMVKTAAELIENAYYPATSKLMGALKTALTSAEHTAGIGRLPQGESLYQALITQMSDTTKSAKEIHQLGLAEVARISAEMDQLLIEVGYSEGSVGERMQILLNDPKYLYPNTAAGKAKLMADIQADLDLIDAKLKHWFGLLPDQAVAIKAVPEHQAASTSGAFYDAPSQDGKRKGTFWISLHDTAALPSYALQTLTYHETNPGHHLQTIIGLSDELPVLSTIFYSNAAGEGWALYAERLAAEMGIYENDPIDNIGRLQAELHRAVRLVVDTGMHAFGWSREKAIEYSVATEGIHIAEATGEIERYVVWPGQALGYKLGELKIRELREKAKKVFGSQFDIRAFHDQILEQGTLPLGLMQQKIDRWLEASK